MSAFTSSSRLACLIVGTCANAPSGGVKAYTAVDVAVASSLAPPVRSSSPRMSPALTGMRAAKVAVPACGRFCGSLACTPVYDPVPAARRARSARPVAAEPPLTRQRTTTPSNGETALGAPLVLSPVNAVHGDPHVTVVVGVFVRSDPMVVAACAAAAG